MDVRRKENEEKPKRKPRVHRKVVAGGKARIKEFDEDFIFMERRIITGMITSTDYIKQVREIWNPALLTNRPARQLGLWCIEHFDKYGKAPYKDIDLKLEKESAKLSKDVVEDIEQILTSLSDDYAKLTEHRDIKVLFADTVDFFKSRQLENLTTEVKQLVEKGELEKADKRVKEFEPIEVTPESKISSFIYSLKEMMEHKIKKPRLLMKPWLREGTITLIYARAGTGKSLLAMSIACVLSVDPDDVDEPDLLNIGEWKPYNPTGCLYVDGEMGEVVLKERLSQFEWIGEPVFPVMSFPLNEYQAATEDSFFLSERKNQLQIVQWLKDHPDYKLLVLDSVTTLFGLVDENNNAEWNSKINPFFRDLKALGVATIILHHSGKDEKRGARGASTIDNMLDYAFCLTNDQKDEDAGEASFTLTKTKQRTAGYLFKDFRIEYYQDSGQECTEWEVFGFKEKNEDKEKTGGLTDKENHIIKLLGRGKTQSEIARIVGLSKGRISQINKQALEDKYIDAKGKHTQKWKDLAKNRYNNTQLELDEY